MSDPSEPKISEPKISEPESAEPNMSEPESDDSLTATVEPRSIAEIVSFWTASAILLILLMGVGYLWVRDRNPDPPALQVSSRVEARQGRYYVPFTLTNVGGQTATTVQVIAELRVDGELVEWGDQIIDFLSSEEKATGSFIFIRNPSAGELTVRVSGYSEP